MKIYYGYDSEHYVDVTHIALNKCVSNNLIVIPKNDHLRANIFGDPYSGFLKHILIVDNLNTQYKIPHYKGAVIEFNSNYEDIVVNNSAKFWYEKIGKFIDNPDERLSELHNHLVFNYGSLSEEYPEQLLTIKFINENLKVLEIGGNVGRNSLIISTILKDSKNLVILESNPEIAKQLQDNLSSNGVDSNIEVSALSQQKLIQNGWNTLPLIDNNIPEGWKEIATITYEQLITKYNINFDTLIADCEGALYYILKDMPQLLNNINMVIVENDYLDINHKNFINSVFEEYGLKRIFYQSGGWGPCYEFFYEVWKKE